jgi:anti-sigma B factor antagonist
VNISSRRVEQATILDISGNIDMSNSPLMRTALLREIQERTAARVVVNMSDVGYIDSSGVASLIEGLKAARDSGLRFVLFGLSESAREVLKISRLLRLFEIYDSEQQALAS